ncbi:transporter substrate-binding domain-containing protein [bacterium]|nr:transporter substrate-binding domain-containing protein [bacterium]
MVDQVTESEPSAGPVPASRMDTLAQATSPPPVTAPRPPDDLGQFDSFEVRAALHRLHENLAFRVGFVGEDLEAEDRLLEEIRSWTKKLDESVERTNSQVQMAMDTLTGLVAETDERLSGVFQDLKTGLATTRSLLDSKTDDLADVLDSVGQIGKTIRMLSINAQIASAKAGEHGKTFSVVAQEIKGLANEATQSSNEAFKIMDLTDVVKVLGGFETLAEETLKRTSHSLQETEARMREMVASTQQELAVISANSRTVGETMSVVKLISERLLEKHHIAERLAAGMDGIWFTEAPDQELAALAITESVPVDPCFDRLDSIRRRGRIRIAIEPDFKGLSFRRDGSELRGLDVDYARAFAKWLGVACEFLEHPWDQCTNLLWVSPDEGTSTADLVWSALPPSPRYRKVAYSETYTWLEFVLARRKGDTRIQGIGDLHGRTLGCINDPAALKTLEDAGIRWSANAQVPGGKVRLGNLITYSDQSRIHDCLADGIVDAFAVDKPIYWWACNGHDSPWHGRIEIVTGNLANQPWYYAVGVADTPSSYRLLREVNAFLHWFATQPARRQSEEYWQGSIVDGRIGYRDERAGLRGEPEMLPDYLKWVSTVKSATGVNMQGD